ncbi:MAG: hypothetical protein ACRC2T_03640, partial [Thermoguttaceae bacterium]
LQKRVGLAEQTMTERYPKTLEYLSRFESLLLERAAYKKYLSDAPFYSIYNVGTHILAEHKVVWRRMDTKIRAAVVGVTPFLFFDDTDISAKFSPQLSRRSETESQKLRDRASGSLTDQLKIFAMVNRIIIPQETTALVPCETESEAAELAAFLNSDEFDAKIRSFSPVGTKGFGSPGVVMKMLEVRG